MMLSMANENPGTDLARVADGIGPAAQAIKALVDLVTEPTSEVVGNLTDTLHYRREVRRVEIIDKAAKRIRAKGLPIQAVKDDLLRAVLNAGADQEDSDMRDRWANLLATAVTEPDLVHPSFPTILSQLAPEEARLMSAMYRHGQTHYNTNYAARSRERSDDISLYGPVVVSSSARLRAPKTWEVPRRETIATISGIGLAITERLGLVYKHRIKTEGPWDVRFTEVGRAFIRACEPEEVRTD